MRTENTVDRKPEIISPATPMTTPTSNFNPNSTILELILTLRSCFQLQHSEVAAILQSREDQLKQNISDLKNREDKLNFNNIELKNQLRTVTNKCTSLEASRESFAAEKERFEAEVKKFKAEREKFAIEKERVEAELKKCKAECEEYRDDKLVAKYELEKARSEANLDLEKARSEANLNLEKARSEASLDLKMWREKAVISAERYEKRIAELDKEKKDEVEGMRVEIVKLRDEIVGLVEGKKKAEKLATYWENLYKQVEPKLMKLENDVLMIFASHPVVGKTVEELRNPLKSGF